ncbi:Signal transduction histidine-protein kinase BarA [Raoultella terrigena]|uniref:histidine kinase n=1 Tax=Raoultella terrigena TaxID=577 RepID=A0A485CD96_RAOTE|nr:Signal transduction histidine-protein kinase BarA [Raoultella terrigena]
MTCRIILSATRCACSRSSLTWWGNAIKFTEHGNIDVLVGAARHQQLPVQIEIQIHDTGIGIPERDQSRLFQAFRQADASISRRHGGTGLGLVITQRLVKEDGGDISFHSSLIAARPSGSISASTLTRTPFPTAR